ncbi:MAG: MFS transporter [Rhizobiales bacterium 62-17]|mgnify:CR=1 FL=1|nr:MFS transporter [Hyphomicrobiales bacterium]OJY00102.1 MAG: MFS transporter [Rhizobiales bacterium 62-17]
MTQIPQSMTAHAVKTSSGNAGWSTTLASTFGLSFGASSLTVLAFAAFMAPLQQEFGWRIPDIAIGASIISIMIMILSPIQGALVDKYGSRPLLLISIPIFAASLAAMYFLPNNLYVFYAAWVVISLCGLGCWPIAYLRATAGWFDRNLGLALGVANAGIGVGAALTPLIVGALISAYGWREAFVGLGILALLVWPVVYFFLAEPARDGAVAIGEGQDFWEAAKTRPFLVALGAFFLLGIFSGTMIVHQVRIFIDAGISPATATAIPSAFGIALIAARLGTGWLLDHVRASIVMAIFLTGGLITALLYAQGPSLTMAIIGTVLAGLIVGAEFDVLSYIIPRYHGRKSLGKIYGAIFAVFQFSSASAIYIAGASRQATGSYSLMMNVIAGICLICIVLFSMMGPYRYQRGKH